MVEVNVVHGVDRELGRTFVQASEVESVEPSGNQGRVVVRMRSGRALMVEGSLEEVAARLTPPIFVPGELLSTEPTELTSPAEPEAAPAPKGKKG